MLDLVHKQICIKSAQLSWTYYSMNSLLKKKSRKKYAERFLANWYQQLNDEIYILYTVLKQLFIMAVDVFTSEL